METVIVTLMSVTLAAVIGATWKLLDKIEASNRDLNDKIDTVGKDLNDKIDAVGKDLAALSERVARIEGHLLGLEVPAGTRD